MTKDEFKIELWKWAELGEIVSMLYFMTLHLLSSDIFKNLFCKTETKLLRAAQITLGQFKCKSDDMLFDVFEFVTKPRYLSELFYGDYFYLQVINNALCDQIDKKSEAEEIKKQLEVYTPAVKKHLELWDSFFLYLDVFLKLQDVYLEKVKKSNLLTEAHIELLNKAKKNTLAFRNRILTVMRELKTAPDPSELKNHEDFIGTAIEKLINKLEFCATNCTEETFCKIYG